MCLFVFRLSKTGDNAAFATTWVAYQQRLDSQQLERGAGRLTWESTKVLYLADVDAFVQE